MAALMSVILGASLASLASSTDACTGTGLVSAPHMAHRHWPTISSDIRGNPRVLIAINHCLTLSVYTLASNHSSLFLVASMWSISRTWYGLGYVDCHMFDLSFGANAALLVLTSCFPSLFVSSHTHARHCLLLRRFTPLTHPLPTHTPPTQTLQPTPTACFISQKESSWTTAGDGPTAGVAQYKATLNGYSFHFKNAANAATFAADPWTWAPAWGGF